jgi:phosphate transport system substrate-binding protein
LKRTHPARRAILGAVLLAGLAGCGGQPQQKASETPAVPVTVVADPSVAAVVRAAAAEVSRLYPGPEVRVESAPARGAMQALFGDRAQAAVLGRELAEEDRQAARQAGIAVEALRWARDGVAIVVHPSNPIEQLALQDVGGVFAGTTTSWADVGGADRRIVPVVQDPESGISQFFVDQVMAGAGVAGPALTVAGDSLAAARVASDPAAIAFVSLPFADRGVKALRIARTRGLPYVALDARTVYEGQYPLVRFYNVVVRVPGSARMSQFNTFLCAEGQRAVRDAGLVPATAPVRFTRRAPTLPSR